MRLASLHLQPGKITIEGTLKVHEGNFNEKSFFLIEKSVAR